MDDAAVVGKPPCREGPCGKDRPCDPEERRVTAWRKRAGVIASRFLLANALGVSAPFLVTLLAMWLVGWGEIAAVSYAVGMGAGLAALSTCLIRPPRSAGIVAARGGLHGTTPLGRVVPAAVGSRLGRLRRS